MRHRRQVRADQEDSVPRQLGPLHAPSVALRSLHAGPTVKRRSRSQPRPDLAQPAELSEAEVAGPRPNELRAEQHGLPARRDAVGHLHQRQPLLRHVAGQHGQQHVLPVHDLAGREADEGGQGLAPEYFAAHRRRALLDLHRLGYAHESAGLPRVRERSLLVCHGSNRAGVRLPERSRSQPQQIEDRQEVSGDNGDPEVVVTGSVLRNFRNVLELVREKLLAMDARMIAGLWGHVVKHLFGYLTFTRL